MDQRRTLRLAVDLPGRCRSATRSVAGRIRNLSQSGVLFVCPPLDPSLTEVTLEIHLPDGHGPLALTGEIRWVVQNDPDPIAAGIRLTHLLPLERRRLANWILRMHQTAAVRFGERHD